VVEPFGDRVKVVVENWGDSPIAKRLGVTRYPAVFVNEAVFANPRDFGFYGDNRGRYTPWLNAANRERFKTDLTRFLDLTLKGEKTQAPAPTPDAAVATLPAFSVKDIEGRDVASKEFAGRPLIVEFWATWCEPCRKSMPWLASLRKKSGDSLGVIALAVDSEEPDVREFAKTGGAGITMAMATPEIGTAFGNILAVPTMFLFDRQGRIAEVFYGAPEDLHDRVEAALTKVMR